MTAQTPPQNRRNNFDARLRPLVAALMLAVSLASGPTVRAASPAVEAALALPRTEPRHYVEAALALNNLGANDQAAKVLNELDASSLDEAALADLVEAIGTARLTRLAVESPAAAPLVGRALEAAREAAHSPERLRRLVEGLAGQREKAIESIRALRRTGEAGVAYCLERIASAEDPKLRARLREALIALDPISQPALYEATGSESREVRTQAAYALGRLAELNRIHSGLPAALVAAEALTGPPDDAAGQAARWAYQRLTGQTATPAAVKRRLDDAVRELLAGQLLFAVDADRPPGSPPTALAMRLAGRLATDRYELDPGSQTAARQALLLRLQAGDDVDPTTVPVRLPEVLSEALRLDLSVAAARCCRLLGEQGDSAAVASLAGQPAALVRALDASHPAVRFAAAEAILAIAPRRPYAGSSRLIETLDYFAAGRGERGAIVASPQLARASQTAGWLLAAGYAATPTNRGAEAVTLATQSPDTRLAMIDVGVSLPGAREVLFRLRSMPSTSKTPVALLAGEGRLAEAQRIAEDHGGEAGRVIATSRPASVEAVVALADRLAAMAPQDGPSADDRTSQAGTARAALETLLSEGPSFYANHHRLRGEARAR